MNFDLSVIQQILVGALNSIVQSVSTYIPNILSAAGILIGGWIIALLVSMGVAYAMRTTKLAHLIAESLHKSDKEGGEIVAKTTKTITFYLLMLFVLIMVFQALNLTLVTDPLNTMLSEIFEFAPRFLGSLGLFVVAWLIASVIRNVLNTIFEKADLDQKLASKTGTKKSEVSVSDSIANTAYWLILLTVLPLVLNTLGLNSVLGPVNNMFGELLGHIPNIFSALVILAIGWFIANILRQIVTNLLASAGADGFLESVGLGKVIAEGKLSEILGLVVYVFILFPVLIASLDALKLEAIVGPATNMLNEIFGVIPNVFAALVMLAIAAFVGRMAATLVENLLGSINFDKLPEWVGLDISLPEDNAPSKLVGKFSFIVIVLFAAMESFKMINLASISDLLNQFIVFAGQIVLGVIILIVGLLIANVASNAIKAAGSAQSGALAGIAKIAILVLASSMSLRQMGFANEIINLAFGLLFGAVAVAFALAFGLGCRDMAAKQLEKFMKDVGK